MTWLHRLTALSSGQTRVLRLCLAKASRPEPWHILLATASGTDPNPGNRFTKQLKEFAWLDDQRKECMTLKDQLGILASAGDAGTEKLMPEMYTRLEELETKIEAQEAQRRKVSEEFEQDREAMERWFRLAGLNNTSAKFAMEHMVQRGFESATLYHLIQRDLRDCPRLTAEEVSQAVKRAAEEMEKSEERQNLKRQEEWAQTKRKLLIRASFLLLVAAAYGLYVLLTSQKVRAVFGLVRTFRPSLPDVYVPREDIEQPIASALHKLDPAKRRYNLVLGPSGSGKSSLMQFCCRRQKGILRTSVVPTTDEQVVYKALANALGLPIEPGVDCQRFVKDVTWWASKLLRQPTAVVLDVFDRPADGASAVREVARQLSATCSVFVCLTPVAYAADCIQDGQATVHWVRDFDEAEAIEATSWRRIEVQAAQASTGLRPGLLHAMAISSTHDLVQQAGQEIQQLVQATPSVKAAVQLLAAADSEKGVLVSDFNAAAHLPAGSPIPYSPALSYDVTGQYVRFMSRTHYTAAVESYGRRRSWWWL